VLAGESVVGKKKHGKSGVGSKPPEWRPDEFTRARIERLRAEGAPHEEVLRAGLHALGAPEMPPDLLRELAGMMRNAKSGEEFADSIFIGDCPFCGFEKATNCEDEPGIENPMVGYCPACKALFCSECRTRMTREKSECANPDCWFNAPEGTPYPGSEHFRDD